MSKSDKSSLSLSSKLKSALVKEEKTERLARKSSLVSAIKLGDVKAFEELLKENYFNTDMMNGTKHRNGTVLHYMVHRVGVAKDNLQKNEFAQNISAEIEVNESHKVKNGVEMFKIALAKTKESDLEALLLAKNDKKKTVLELAIEDNNWELVKIIAEVYIDKKLDIFGDKALQTVPLKRDRPYDAEKGKLLESLKDLLCIARFTVPNITSDVKLFYSEGSEKSANPIHLAIKYDLSKQTIEHLIDNGIDLNQQNSVGDTPLHLAARKGDIDLVNLFLRNQNIDINLVNKEDETFLDLLKPEERLKIEMPLFNDLQEEVKVEPKIESKESIAVDKKPILSLAEAEIIPKKIKEPEIDHSPVKIHTKSENINIGKQEISKKQEPERERPPLPPFKPLPSAIQAAKPIVSARRGPPKPPPFNIAPEATPSSHPEPKTVSKVESAERNDNKGRS